MGETLASLPAEVQLEPLTQWPGGYERTPEEERRSSDFPQAGILDRTIRDLQRELGHLEPELVVLQLDIKEGRIRQDGLPYANASIGSRDPGVVLTLEMPDGSVQTYPCDTYRSWEENLRAIAYVLHDLRRISRHGVGQGSEQYRGFAQLPANVDDRMGPREAARLLCRTAPGEWDGMPLEAAVNVVLEDPESFRSVYRTASKLSHPDRSVNDAHFKRVQTARSVLEQHHEERRRKELAS